MANLNDYKLLSRICQRHFEMASKIVPQLGNVKGLSGKQIERYGFYYLVLQHFTGVADFPDLRSVREEQKQLEQLFALHDILYQRKNGNTGDPVKNYCDSLNMVLLGQLLLARSGYPELISNRKKEIFNKFYNKLFLGNDKLISEETIDLFKTYRKIEGVYRQMGMRGTVQRCMYIIYMSHFIGRDDYKNMINELEKFASDFIEQNSLSRSVSRVFIYAPFKKELDKCYGISETKLMNLD